MAETLFVLTFCDNLSSLFQKHCEFKIGILNLEIIYVSLSFRKVAFVLSTKGSSLPN